jgi:hypothetical protein
MQRGRYFECVLALVWLIAALLALVNPITAIAFLALLVPVWFFFASVLICTAAPANAGPVSSLFGFVSVFSPRPPPTR